jgi:hypothetical protein
VVAPVAFCTAFDAFDTTFGVFDSASVKQDEVDGIDNAPSGAITSRSGLA